MILLGLDVEVETVNAFSDSHGAEERQWGEVGVVFVDEDVVGPWGCDKEVVGWVSDGSSPSDVQ